MQSLAAGIPCVSHMWVIESCKQQQALKRENYLLPAGFSIITNSLPSDKYANSLKSFHPVFITFSFVEQFLEKVQICLEVFVFTSALKILKFWKKLGFLFCQPLKLLLLILSQAPLERLLGKLQMPQVFAITNLLQVLTKLAFFRFCYS